MFRKELDKAEADIKRSNNIIADYKQVNIQLGLSINIIAFDANIQPNFLHPLDLLSTERKAWKPDSSSRQRAGSYQGKKETDLKTPWP